MSLQVKGRKIQNAGVISYMTITEVLLSVEIFLARQENAVYWEDGNVLDS